MLFLATLNYTYMSLASITVGLYYNILQFKSYLGTAMFWIPKLGHLKIYALMNVFALSFFIFCFVFLS